MVWGRETTFWKRRSCAAHGSRFGAVTPERHERWELDPTFVSERPRRVVGLGVGASGLRMPPGQRVVDNSSDQAGAPKLPGARVRWLMPPKPCRVDPPPAAF